MLLIPMANFKTLMKGEIHTLTLSVVMFLQLQSVMTVPQTSRVWAVPDQPVLVSLVAEITRLM